MFILDFCSRFSSFNLKRSKFNFKIVFRLNFDSYYLFHLLSVHISILDHLRAMERKRNVSEEEDGPSNSEEQLFLVQIPKGIDVNSLDGKHIELDIQAFQDGDNHGNDITFSRINGTDLEFSVSTIDRQDPIIPLKNRPKSQKSSISHVERLTGLKGELELDHNAVDATKGHLFIRLCPMDVNRDPSTWSTLPPSRTLTEQLQ